MNYVRWYDKDPYLSPVMNLLEKLPVEIQDSIAQDLLQLIMSYQDISHDNKIEYLNQNTLPSYRRWYDINPNLHSSIELLKNTDPQIKKEICESVVEFLFQILLQENLLND